MRSLQITIAATNTIQPLNPQYKEGIANGVFFQNLVLQNNGSNNMRIGDASISSTKGLLINATGSNTSVLPLSFTGNLNEWFVVGTQNDVLDILLIE